MRLGVVGSGEFRDKEFVIKKLEEIVNPEIDIIVSGHSPRKKYNNVDIWAEEWAYEFCENEPIIHPAEEFTDTEFFRRNKEVNYDSDKLLVFINEGKYKSGAWNTVGYFINKFDFNINNLIIYNERHRLWRFEELPMWVRNRIKHMKEYKKVVGLF